MKWLGLIAIWTFVLFAILAQTVQASVVIPRSLRTDPATATWQILGPSCQAMNDSLDSLPCNPAFLSQDLVPQWRGGLRLSDHIKYWDEVQDLVEGSPERSTIQNLFRQNENSSLETSLELSYTRSKLGLAITPFRLGFFSNFENPALPLIQTLAYQERNLRVQLGSYIQGPWSWGIEGRVARREVIAQEFFLTDVFVEGGADRFKPIVQNSVYLEPALLYEFQNTKWNPKLSFMVNQFGVVDHKIEEFPASPEFTLSGSVQPEIKFGNLQMGLAARYFSTIEVPEQLLSLSTIYQLGFAQYLIGLSVDRQSFGYNLSYHGFQAGLQYAYEKLLNRIITVQVGYEF